MTGRRPFIDAMLRTRRRHADSLRSWFAAVAPCAADSDIASALAAEIMECAPPGMPAPADTRSMYTERRFHLWTRAPIGSPGWRSLLVQLVFFAVADSRADLMRLLQEVIPSLQPAFGVDPALAIAESLECAAEWWP